MKEELSIQVNGVGPGSFLPSGMGKQWGTHSRCLSTSSPQLMVEGFSQGNKFSWTSPALKWGRGQSSRGRLEIALCTKMKGPGDAVGAPAIICSRLFLPVPALGVPPSWRFPGRESRLRPPFNNNE